MVGKYQNLISKLRFIRKKYTYMLLNDNKYLTLANPRSLASETNHMVLKIAKYKNYMLL